MSAITSHNEKDPPKRAFPLRDRPGLAQIVSLQHRPDDDAQDRDEQGGAARHRRYSANSPRCLSVSPPIVFDGEMPSRRSSLFTLVLPTPRCAISSS